MAVIELVSIFLSPVLIVCGWLGRDFLRTWLTRRVENEFNQKLEILRAQLRESEERLKADLHAREAEVTALRNGALTALGSRQIAVDYRRLEAVDQLWSAVLALLPARSLMRSMAVIEYEPAAEAAEADSKVRELFSSFGNEEVLLHLDTSSAGKARPFVSLSIWATYTALSALSHHAVVRWHTLKSGLGTKGLVNNDAVANLIKVALPHKASLIDDWGPSGWHYLYEELEAKLLQEFQTMLEGKEADALSLKQTAEIIRLANEITIRDSTKV
ncbi:MAG: hypothetical protein IPQ13_10220 [Holophagaceae bacterium]|nr:hypothetical protein [Holophagaceae bacterium]